MYCPREFLQWKGISFSGTGDSNLCGFHSHCKRHFAPYAVFLGTVGPQEKLWAQGFSGPQCEGYGIHVLLSRIYVFMSSFRFQAVVVNILWSHRRCGLLYRFLSGEEKLSITGFISVISLHILQICRHVSRLYI